MTDHTPSSKVSRLEVISTGARRRWTLAEKQRIVAGSQAGWRQVSATARRYSLSVSQLFTWCRVAREGRLFEGDEATTFAPVLISSAPSTSSLPSLPGRIEIVLEVRASCDRRQWRRFSGAGAGSGGAGATMIPLPSGVRVWLANGHTDMRKGFPGLSLQVQEVLRRDPLSGHLFCFRGRRGDLLKVIWHDGQGACLFTKKLERGRFIWPSLADGVVSISQAQMSYLLSGIDWRNPQESWRPTSVG